MSGSKSILRDAELQGWEEALSKAFSGEELDLASHPERAAFVHLLPAQAGARVLELAAGWGNITIELARASYRVHALERDADRTSFIALRAKAEGLAERITALPGGIETVPAGAFEAIVLHEPALTCASVLPELRERLAPGGIIYVGGPIRRPWDGEGATFAAYVRLFAGAGLRIREAYASPRGYRNPSELVPLQASAIEHYTRMRIEPPGSNLMMALKNAAKNALAKPASWKLLAPSFVFFLEAADA